MKVMIMKRKSLFLIVSWFLVFSCMIYFAPQNASAVMINMGDTATFMFDFGSADFSNATGLWYVIEAPDPYSSLLFISSADIFDELEEFPRIANGFGVRGSFTIAAARLHHPGLFDDPISYMDYTPDNSELMSADFNVHAELFSSIDGVRTDIARADGIIQNSIPVPEPSTIVLMGLGLVGLAGIGRKRMRR